MTVIATEFNSGQSQELYAFTNGISWDRLMATQEVAVQSAWLNALSKAGLVDPNACNDALNALREAERQMVEGVFPWNVADEDIHMNLERFVCDTVGDIGKTMHLGRSRNDLIATTLRLFVNDKLKMIRGGVVALIYAAKEIAARNMEIIVPGMTHLQHGQPVRLSHIWLSYAQMFMRDSRRIQAAQEQCLSSMPLGSAAFAGSTIAIDLDEIAEVLGFNSIAPNSYDAVGDRDFMLESLNAMAILATHLSRLSEDIIVWASTPVALVRLPSAYATGSSIMPNKRNPDVAELTRAKASRIIATSSEALNLMKSLSSSYNTDLHELKKTFFLASSELEAVLAIYPPFLEALKFSSTAAKRLLHQGHILATDLANTLAQQSNFRDAYRVAAAEVQCAEEQGVQVHQVHQIYGDEEPDPFEASVETHRLAGGTSLHSVKHQIEGIEQFLQKETADISKNQGAVP